VSLRLVYFVWELLRVGCDIHPASFTHSGLSLRCFGGVKTQDTGLFSGVKGA
jgi:hypothetical protein